VNEDEEEYLQALLAMDEDFYLDLLFPAFFAFFAIFTLFLKRYFERPQP
jgi:hypothetical protein